MLYRYVQNLSLCIHQAVVIFWHKYFTAQCKYDMFIKNSYQLELVGWRLSNITLLLFHCVVCCSTCIRLGSSIEWVSHT